MVYRAVQSALLSSGCIISLAFRFMFALWLACTAAQLPVWINMYSWSRNGDQNMCGWCVVLLVHRMVIWPHKSMLYAPAAAVGYHGAQLPLLL